VVIEVPVKALGPQKSMVFGLIVMLHSFRHAFNIMKTFRRHKIVILPGKFTLRVTYVWNHSLPDA
jgi:tetrahydromethanopterin S-methyltransferase subunit E